MLDPLYKNNRDLNQNISMQEVEKIIMNVKNENASGIDNIRLWSPLVSFSDTSSTFALSVDIQH